MRPYGKQEIKHKAQTCFDRWISYAGLRNAEKIVAETKRMLAAEKKRRKEL